MHAKFTNLGLFLIALSLAAVPAHAGLGNLLKKGTETKTSNDAENAKMPAYKGVRHAIGVSDFANETHFQRWSDLNANIRAMLESSLAESGRFVVVERGNLGSVIAEQDFKQSGRVAASKEVAETGKLRSARFMVSGVLTEISEGNSGEDGGIGFGGVRIRAGSSKSAVVIVVKLVDTTSGEVVASKRVRGEAGKTGLGISFVRNGVAGAASGFAKTPMGEAVQDCIDTAVRFIAESMQRNEIESSVVAVTKSEVVIAMGSNYGIEPGMTLMVRKNGEILTDEDTGAILDRLEGETTGSIEVLRVREKTAYAKLVEGVMPARGDRVVVASK